jgi:hypothetical protein
MQQCYSAIFLISLQPRMGNLPQTQCSKTTSRFLGCVVQSARPPEILFKQCAICQVIATLARNPYTTQELLQNALDLIAQCGLYQCDIEDWEQKPLGNQTWINLHPFIQEYQCRLTSGTITSTQSGYAKSNCFIDLATNKDFVNNTEDTISETITLHMANLTAQTTATLNEHATQTNASLQQLAANNAQLHQQQQAIMNHMAMMSLGGAYQGAPAVMKPQQTAHIPPQIYLPPALPHHQQGYYNTPQQSGGHGHTAGQSSGCSCSRRGHAHGRGSPQVPIPYDGGAQLVLYIQGVAQQGQHAHCYEKNQMVRKPEYVLHVRL